MKTEYWIEATNTPDGDGDYCAAVYSLNGRTKSYFRKNRDEAIKLAREWVERDRHFDASDIERIDL